MDRSFLGGDQPQRRTRALFGLGGLLEMWLLFFLSHCKTGMSFNWGALAGRQNAGMYVHQALEFGVPIDETSQIWGGVLF